MTLIVALSWRFWLSPQNLAIRLELSIIFMLTTVTASLGFADHIPPIAYLTFLDTIFISMLLMIFFSSVESIVAHYLLQRSNESAALALDHYSLIFAPILLLGILGVLYLLFFGFE